MGSKTKQEAEENLLALGNCPVCGSSDIEVRWNDSADLVAYCRECKEYFEV